MTLESKENYPRHTKIVQNLLGFMPEVKPLHKPRGDLVLWDLNESGFQGFNPSIVHVMSYLYNYYFLDVSSLQLLFLRCTSFVINVSLMCHLSNHYFCDVSSLQSLFLRRVIFAIVVSEMYHLSNYCFFDVSSFQSLFLWCVILTIIVSEMCYFCN